MFKLCEKISQICIQSLFVCFLYFLRKWGGFNPINLPIDKKVHGKVNFLTLFHTKPKPRQEGQKYSPTS